MRQLGEKTVWQRQTILSAIIRKDFSDKVRKYGPNFETTHTFLKSIFRKLWRLDSGRCKR